MHFYLALWRNSFIRLDNVAQELCGSFPAAEEVQNISSWPVFNVNQCIFCTAKNVICLHFSRALIQQT